MGNFSLNGKSRGLVFTMAAAALIAALLVGINAFQEKRASSLPSIVSDDSFKVHSAWADAAEEIVFVTGLSIEKNEENVTFSDTLPALRDISDDLSIYEKFLNFSKPADLNYSFVNPDGTTGSLSSLEPPIVIQPWGINYTYPVSGGGDAWGKRELQIVCDDDTDNCDNVSRIDMTFVINDTFKFSPLLAANQNKFNWNPDPDSDACTPFDAHCVDFSLNITDSTGESYICVRTNPAQVTCDYQSFTWNAGSSPKIEIDVNTCTKIIVILGGDELVTFRMLDSANDPCGQTNSTIKLEMNSSDFFVDFATKLKVRDNAFNSSLTRKMS